jgi:hypothetical protein
VRCIISLQEEMKSEKSLRIKRIMVSLAERLKTSSAAAKHSAARGEKLEKENNDQLKVKM